jgi:hypothetical protein
VWYYELNLAPNNLHGIQTPPPYSLYIIYHTSSREDRYQFCWLMSSLPIEHTRSSLSPGQTVESPGSSVFDLPTQLSSATQSDRRPTQLQEISQQPAADTLTSYSKSSPRFLVISGGTGGNSICSAFGDACYVLPVSDDGGSSSEIIRVLGGPSIGARRVLQFCFPVG